MGHVKCFVYKTLNWAVICVFASPPTGGKMRDYNEQDPNFLFSLTDKIKLIVIIILRWQTNSQEVLLANGEFYAPSLIQRT